MDATYNCYMNVDEATHNVADPSTVFFLTAAAKPSRAPAPDEYLISPITGERIPASQVAEHMRIGLLDPRWVEQRDRQLNEKVNQETVFATGESSGRVRTDGGGEGDRRGEGSGRERVG